MVYCLRKGILGINLYKIGKTWKQSIVLNNNGVLFVCVIPC